MATIKRDTLFLLCAALAHLTELQGGQVSVNVQDVAETLNQYRLGIGMEDGDVRVALVSHERAEQLIQQGTSLDYLA
jgi:hypothetical protein